MHAGDKFHSVMVKMAIITTDTDAWSDLKWLTTTFQDRCFFILSQTWDKEKIIAFPWGIQLQTLGFCPPMLTTES